MSGKSFESKGQVKSNIPSFDFRRSVVRAADKEAKRLDVPSDGGPISCSVSFESSIQHGNWGRMVRVFQTYGSGFDTPSARDERRKLFLFHGKKLGWMRWATLVETYQPNEDFAKRHR